MDGSEVIKSHGKVVGSLNELTLYDNNIIKDPESEDDQEQEDDIESGTKGRVVLYSGEAYYGTLLFLNTDESQIHSNYQTSSIIIDSHGGGICGPFDLDEVKSIDIN